MTYTGHPDWQDPTQPQGGNDLLLNTIIPVGQSFKVANLSQTLGQYQRYWVLCVADHPCLITAEVIDPTIGYGPSYSRYQVANSQATFALPALGTLGITPQLSVTLSSNAVNFPVSIECWGLRYFPDSYRFDGLPQPMNSQAGQQVLVAAGTVTVIPAPTLPNRVLVGTALLGSTLAGGGANTQLTANIGGVSIPFVNTIGGPGQIAHQYPMGLLLDPGAAVLLLQSAAGASEGVVTYDIVT